ncbi:MAG: flagellar basal-body MS-ring/collar protein FliF [Verrucomicrobiota bacterium]|nr:flagellar basal-body MS-ring/collar protein FliF [Verrucomicrobiota bacterium]
MDKIKAMAMQLLTIWQQLGVNQKVTVAASGLLVAGALSVVVFFTSKTDFALLYGNMDSKSAGEIIAVLEEQKIPFEAGAGGTSIMVPREKVYSLRMTLASRGLPKAGDVGWELFDNKNTVSMSDFVQQNNKVRALQGELARSIAMIQGVSSARVHVVLPKTRLIVDENKKGTAAVLLNLSSAGSIRPEAVHSIRHLVAGGIEGLQPNNVMVTDNYGNTLTTSGEGNGAFAMANNRLTTRRNYEKYLAAQVRSTLEPALGPGQVIVTVSAEINHDQITHTSINFDPDGVVTNQYQSTLDSSGDSTPRPGGVVGATANTNTSTNNAGGALANNTQNKEEKTITFNNSQNTTNTVMAVGKPERITASVLVAQGATARNAAAMLQLTNVVKNAIGLHIDGGVGGVRPDDIVVEEILFNDAHLTVAKEELDSATTKAMISDLVRNILYVLLGAGALMAFVKLVKRSADDVIPTGVPVGQLLAGTAMVAAPAGAMMAAPAGGGASTGAIDAVSQIADSAKSLEDIEEALKDPSKLSTAEIQQLMDRRKEEKERRKMLEAMADEEDEDDVEVIEQEKQKLIMDFGIGKKQPERVNIEVLRDMIKESPESMAVAARRWLAGGNEDKDDEGNSDDGAAS